MTKITTATGITATAAPAPGTTSSGITTTDVRGMPAPGTTSSGITATDVRGMPAPTTGAPGITALHRTFKKFGSLSLVYRQKCIGMLPEINRLRVYEKKGFGSIFEYAAKLAGISREQVQRVLRLERRFEDKPALHNVLIKGEASVSKLAKIASIATENNQQELADSVKILSRRALETLARDQRILNEQIQNEKKSVPGNRTEGKLCLEQANSCVAGNTEPPGDKSPEKLFHLPTVELAEDVEMELAALQQKGIDINRELREFLAARKQKIAEQKERIAKEISEENNSQNTQSSQGGQTDRKGGESANKTPQLKPASRHIPARIKKIVRLEHGSQCSIPHCNRPAAVIHHTRRFALARSHDPRFLAPLCREHHQLAHAVDAVYRGKRMRAG